MTFLLVNVKSFAFMVVRNQKLCRGGAEMPLDLNQCRNSGDVITR